MPKSLDKPRVRRKQGPYLAYAKTHIQPRVVFLLLSMSAVFFYVGLGFQILVLFFNVTCFTLLLFLLLLAACVNCLAGRERAPWNTPLFAISRSFDGPLFMIIRGMENQLVSCGGLPPGRDFVP